MSVTMTAAGEALLANLQAQGLPLVIDKFFFANVPDLDHTLPINAALGLPTEHVVHEFAIPPEYRAYVNPNQVVYSALLGSDVGPFSCNWQGLYCSEHDVLVAVATFPRLEKRAYDADTNTQGNNLTRNFLLEFTGATELTQITVEAAVWQLDFTVRLKGIDERERLSNRDLYDRAAFLDDGWLLTENGGTYRFESGRGYVEGIRAALGEALPVVPTSTPCDVWLDVSMQGQGSDVVTVVSPVTLAVGSACPDYFGGAPSNVRHYCEQVARIEADGSVTDLRPKGAEVLREIIGAAPVDHTHTAAQVGAAPALHTHPDARDRLANQRIAVLDGLYAMQQQAGQQSLLFDVYEPFTDLGGMDGAASHGVQHDADACCVSNPGGFIDWLPTAQAEWQDGGYSSYWAWSGDDVADTGTDTSNAYNKAIRTARTFNGDFAWRYKVGPLNKAYFNAVYAADEDATFVFSNAQGNTQNMTKAWRWYPGYYVHYGDTQVGSLATVPEAIGDVWEIRRKAGVFSLWRNGVLVFTWNETYTGPMRAVVMGYDQQRQDYDDLAFSETLETPDMLYQSATVQFPAPPEALYLLAFVAPGEGAVYNTDIAFELSADGGATWQAVGVEKPGTSITGLDIVTGQLAGLSGGQTVAFRVRHSAAVVSATHFVAVQA